MLLGKLCPLPASPVRQCGVHRVPKDIGSTSGRQLCVSLSIWACDLKAARDTADSMNVSIEDFVREWEDSAASERANKDLFCIGLSELLGVPRPQKSTGDSARDTYVFEHDATFVQPDGRHTVGKIDLYKKDCFILEAKQGSHEKAKRRGTARRESASWFLEMEQAQGQALGYASTLDVPPPILLIVDIGYCFDLYACFDGSRRYRGFPDPLSKRIFFRDLVRRPEHLETLRAVFTDPLSLDPSRRAAKVTREVAESLAELAKTLDAAKHPPEAVAKFLMRCLFTMFAEDVGLLPELVDKTEVHKGLFTYSIKKFWLPNPASFVSGVQSLWRAMDTGSSWVIGELRKFNGGLFKDSTALPLDKEGLNLLLRAAERDWCDVEPAIFGTLLERALDPRERHALGAHYTPRAYVERLVRPTIEEPLRADWDVVRAEVRQLVAEVDDAKKKAGPKAKRAAANALQKAVDLVHGFHRALCETRVLDPACGSGNFLYVTLDLFKRLEGEILDTLSGLGHKQELMAMETVRVTPAQFLGIEVKPWAKEIAELVLWIGYLQWHFRSYGKTLPVPDPVLRDYKNIECRDAVLAYDSQEMVLDERGRPAMRWDGLTYKRSTVTGEDIPDDRAQVPLYRYTNPRKAEWPKANFVIGNPPFVGNKRMRNALGDGYVAALRSVWDDVPDAADYVMYWWSKAAALVRSGEIRRFGLITTNSITQSFNRRLVESFLAGDQGSLSFAIPDHPWVDSESGAAVRIAMTVGQAGLFTGNLSTVSSESEGHNDNQEITFESQAGSIHADLTIGAPVSRCVELAANKGLAFTGMYPLGQGFVLAPADVKTATGGQEKERNALFPFFIARDLTQTARNAVVIDFYPRSEAEVQRDFPNLYQWVLSRVKPQRDQDKRPTRKAKWWLFAEPVPALRKAVSGLPRQIFVPRTAKFFTFQFMSPSAEPDTSVVAIATDSAFVLGILSSRIHLTWAYERGGRLGVGNDPRYQHVSTFNPFPFPLCSPLQQDRIRDLGEALDAHRKRQQAQNPTLTITGMYNVLMKLRSGETLSKTDKVIHDQGLVSLLKKIHDDLDSAVFDAYGWPLDLSEQQILEGLVKLNAERAEEETRGLVRWLRPDFQNPSGKQAAAQTHLPAAEGEQSDPNPSTRLTGWPKKLAEQIAAVRDLVLNSDSPSTAEQVATHFKGATADATLAVLESLEALGLVVSFEANGALRWAGAVRAIGAQGPSAEAAA